MTTTKSYYLQRGDTELRELNQTLDELNLTPTDFVDLLAVRENDGLRLSLAFEQDTTLRLLGSSPPNNSWYQTGEFPDPIELVFNRPVSKGGYTDGDIKVVTTAATTNIALGDITWNDDDQVIQFASSMVAGAYKGLVSIVVADLENIEGEPMGATTLGTQVSDQDTQAPKSGENASLYNEPYGLMQVGRLVAARGMDKDVLIQQYLTQHDLLNSKVVKILQVGSSNGTTDIFLLWWLQSSPRVMNISPAPNGTVPQEDASDQLVIEFSEPVSEEHLGGLDGEERLFLDGAAFSGSGAVLTSLDATGRVWLLSNWGAFTATGNHVLLVKNLPTIYGERPGPPMFYTWQVLPMAIAGGGGGGANQCEVPSGTINGVNAVFTLAQIPDTCSLHLFQNGIFQDPDCYTLVDNTITMGTAPSTGWQLYAMYLYTAP